MPRLFIGNFSFETTRDRNQELPKHLKLLEAELATVWLTAANEGDFILCPKPISLDYFERMRGLGFPSVKPVSIDMLSKLKIDDVCCWGWSLPMRRFCDKQKMRYQAPLQQAIWRVNSRVYSVELERTLNCELQGTCVLSSMSDVDTWSEHAGETSWVLKTDLSQSGSGQIRGSVNPQILRWLQNNIKRGESIIAEPLLTKFVEVGCQWDISISGEVHFVGAAELLSNERGGYLGSQTGTNEARNPALDQILTVQREAVEQIAREGYFGPVGIDAMVYVSADGTLKSRPLQDINARWTMGRIALGFEHVFGKAGCWIHSKEPPEPDAVRTSPEYVDGNCVQHTHWWI